MIIKDGTLEHGEYFIHKSTSNQWAFDSKVQGTYYGYSTETCDVFVNGKSRWVNAHTVWSFPTKEFTRLWVTTASCSGELVLFFCPDYIGQSVSGVELEEAGRLQYIDGCTDSLLIYAPKKGDPCLNHLHFPAGIDQTFHTHPSIRMGYVARGNGVASFPDGDHALNTGDIFLLPVDELHRFRTPNESMDIIAFHPETDTGPTDEDHPMLNRTIIPE